MGDYFGFEDVMQELELGEEELKRMVSEGELRAFRDENKMKFKKEDVDNLKKGRITEPTIILPSMPSDDPVDETSLDLDIGNETAALASVDSADSDLDFTEAGTDPGGDSDLSPFDTDDDLLVTEATGSEIGSDTTETFIEEDSETGLGTEPIEFEDDATLEADVVEEELEAPAPSRSRTRAGRRITAQVPVAVEAETQKASPLWAAVLLLSVLAGTASGLFFYDTMRLESSGADRPIGLTGDISTWILTDYFWADTEWKSFHTKEFPENGTVQPPFKDTSNNPLLDYPKEVYNKPSFEISDSPTKSSQ